jgi:hypothetical protein
VAPLQGPPAKKIRVVWFCIVPLVAPSQKSTCFDPSGHWKNVKCIFLCGNPKNTSYKSCWPCRGAHLYQKWDHGCGDPGLPPGIPVMHTVHDPRKTVVNPHNIVGISDYIIHYIMSLKVLHRPLGRIQMPCRASSTDTRT